ncbi:glycerophosphodiester phosphodiesterase family protein [Jatrophihabitans sp. DSM 45814]
MEPIAFAHRGFSPIGAENSLAAFQAAVDLGYRYLETDARASADGVAVAFHDALLDRLTNHTGRLNALTWNELSQARIVGSEPIPRLEDLLGQFGHAFFNIDVKTAAVIGPTLDAVRRTNSWHRVRLATFSDRRLSVLRKVAGPYVATSLSPSEIVSLKLASVGPQVIRSVPARLPVRRQFGGARAAQVPAGPRWLRLVDRTFIESARERGFEVHVWTVNRRSEMHRLLDLGVDGIMTDRADVLREVLEQRGQWK